MRVLIATLVTLYVMAVAGTGGPALPAGGVAAASGAAAESGQDLGRETLAPNDGWAAYAGGTSGGAAATAEHIFTVTNRQELVGALGHGDVPKIIYVKGTIDANVDDHNQPLSCDDYAADGYSLEAYLAAYDPAVWGRDSEPSGPLEDARRASQRKQAARIRINVGSNTTLVGLGSGARIVGANLMLNQVDNVIIRNISLEDAYDCFPQWDPTDGSEGSWNSQYDNISVRGASHVWVDHCSFSDGANPDSRQPTYFGQPFQVHDGLLDITHGSDLATVSWNIFADHDKTMLIGSTDSPRYDVGKLRVTVHHNLFANVVQRAPRVRYGQVHVYNNYYDIPSAENYGYSWGVGVQSRIYAENNYFRTAADLTPDQLLRAFRGSTIHAAGTLVNGQAAQNQVDLVAAYNAVNDPDLIADAGWTPTLYNLLHPTHAVPGVVVYRAGPSR